MNKISVFFLLIITSILFPANQIYAQEKTEASILFDDANKHFSKGEYREAIRKYDKILELVPGNISTLKMKGVALSNLGEHEQSLKQFYKIYQENPKDIVSLLGLGVGFGYLGEYAESSKYFEMAYALEPENQIVNNYKNFVNKVISKYPYKPTQKPVQPIVEHTIIPDWVKPVARWWAAGSLSDSEFIRTIQFLLEKKLLQVPQTKAISQIQDDPNSIKENAGLWVNGHIPDGKFVSGIQFMIENKILIVNYSKSLAETQKEKEQDFLIFERYLKQISKNVIDEKRYIEYPNPSFDVIKKFLRDYVKWNFEQEARSASAHFPNPTFQEKDGKILINYKIYVNEQPSGLPLDHVSTLNNSIEFWEKQTLSANNKTAKVEFTYTKSKSEANIWVTWVVRDLGQGVLGHAHLGKGIVEVALGDYSCDGTFQLYDVKTVETIMTHELGHSIGLQHSSDPKNIMFTSMKPKYAYCLLG